MSEPTLQQCAWMSATLHRYERDMALFYMRAADMNDMPEVAGVLAAKAWWHAEQAAADDLLAHSMDTHA